MPIYEYECSACGHRLEVLQKISDAPLTQCPECGAEALRKAVTAAGFRLKGTGWYETDFKHSGKKADKAGKADKKPAGEGGKPDGGGAQKKAKAGDR